ncbi:class I SAM-dependent methyltransferase [Pseudidiomarina sp.]|uniref:class I SAM-dependent methyltransferase n=1 Tax=Pseudidiomarina sp. TaxID=2081707 RepID=UPI00299DB578|nr:class I SAM-dependent methyltransferase [Pseudidiomarina sp.]MDX1705425.1 class I SAM-dependent methyltransferase [Pseudidiomarina sp.]
MSCPLCLGTESELFYRQPRAPLAGREFWQCLNCQLVWVPKPQHLDESAEKAIYDLHENNPEDPGYRRFLGKALNPLIGCLPKGAQGLDFGSGPGPALSGMLRDKGFACADYDYYYARHPELLSKTYDFITATEVVEHLSDPRSTIEQLLGCLKPGGRLLIMTKRWQDPARFGGWSYKNDPTHISIFHRDTLHWLARQYQLRIDYISDDVVIFTS